GAARSACVTPLPLQGRDVETCRPCPPADSAYQHLPDLRSRRQRSDRREPVERVVDLRCGSLDRRRCSLRIGRPEILQRRECVDPTVANSEGDRGRTRLERLFYLSACERGVVAKEKSGHAGRERGRAGGAPEASVPRLP